MMEILEFIKNITTKKKINKLSLKTITNNPMVLSKLDYISHVLNNIDDYAITDKADGIRAIVIFYNDGRYTTITGKSFINAEFFDKDSILYIFDTEQIDNKYYIFDIFYNKVSVAEEPFSVRYKMIQSINLHSDFCLKEFLFLSNKNYGTAIYELWNKSHPYEIDGIIFTQISKSYIQTINYKWKPPEHLTIDFLTKYNADIKGYELYNGIDKYMASKLKLRVLSNYGPIKFEPSLITDSNVNILHLSDGGKMDDKIIECIYNDGVWSKIKERVDKVKDKELGIYYGNNFRIAEQTFQTKFTNFTLEDLTKSIVDLTGNNYFNTQDDNFKVVRKFNSFVKNKLISRFRYTKVLLDLGSGKGQDLYNYFSTNTDNLFMVEYDINAIEEIIKRKYDIINNLRNINGTNLKIAHADLTKPYKVLLDKLRNGGFTQANVIMCNFALHYFIDSEKNLNNIVMFINSALKSGGMFVFTALNAKKVNVLLSGNKVYKKDKYYIEKLDANNINIKLPCASSQLYKEKLIDDNILSSALAKYNIIKVEENSHLYFEQEFAQKKQHFYRELNSYDKIFIDLYSYRIYKKT